MNDLSTNLHEWANRAADSHPPVAELIAAGTKRRNRRRAGAAGTAALALAAVVGGALATTGGTAPASTATTAAGSAQSPAMELASAVTATAGSSYKFGIKSTLTLPAWQIDHVTSTCDGALDPHTQNGYLTTNSVFSARVVTGHLYVAKGDYWFDAGKGDVSNVLKCSDSKAPAGASADPATELKILQKVGTVTKDAAGFSFTGDEVTGTAKVSDGRVVQISYTVTHPETKDYPAYTRETTMALSGFGEKVSVKKPM